MVVPFARLFRSEATDTRMGSGSAVELKTERFVMAFRLLLGCGV